MIEIKSGEEFKKQEKQASENLSDILSKQNFEESYKKFNLGY